MAQRFRFKEGSVGRQLKFHFVPPLTEECFSRSWLSILFERREGTPIVLLPIEHLETDGIPEEPRPGDSFTWRSSRVLGTMELLGWLEKKKVYEEVLVTDADYERILRLVSGDLRFVYTFTFVLVPSYWQDLILRIVADDPTVAEVTYDDDDMDVN